MIGIGGLESAYGQTDLLSAHTLGDTMTSSNRSMYEVRGDRGFAAFARGGMARLKAYIEGKLELNIEDEKTEQELDFQDATELMYALGTDMGSHLDMAVWAQRYVDPDRAVSLIW